MTSAQLAIVGATAPLTNQATVYLGCKGVDAGRPVLELRFLIPQLRGINPAAIGNSATLAIGDDKFPASLDSFPVQNMTMFIVNPNPAAAKDMASLKLNQRANLYLYFQTGGRNAFFVTTLMDPSGPVSTVLTACGVAIPAASPIPTNAATPEMKKYTFQGIHLGMSAQEAAAVEKTIATTPIKPSPGGGVDFETPQFYFISVTADDSGLITFYKVCGKTSGTVKAGPKSGPSMTWQSNHSDQRQANHRTLKRFIGIRVAAWMPATNGMGTKSPADVSMSPSDSVGEGRQLLQFPRALGATEV